MSTDKFAATVVSETGKKQMGPCKAFPYSKNRPERPEYDDRAKALMAVKQHGTWPNYHSDRLRDDKEVVLAAVAQNRNALQYASDRLRDDEDVVKAAMATSAYALRHASPRLQGDTDIILAHASCAVLEVAAPEAFRKENKNFVLSFIKLKPHTFPYLHIPTKRGVVDVDWRDDKEVALLALKRHPEFASYLTPRLWNDRDIILAALEAPVGCHWFAQKIRGGIISQEIQEDRGIALAALTKEPQIYQFLPENLRNDRAVAIAAVSKGHARQLEDLPWEFRGDKGVVMAAIKGYDKHDDDPSPYGQDWFAEISDELRSDPAIIVEALQRNGLFLRDVILGGSNRDVELVKVAIKNSAIAMSYVPDGLKNRPDIAAYAMQVADWDWSSGDSLRTLGSTLGESLIQQLEEVDDALELKRSGSDRIDLRHLTDVNRWSQAWKQMLWYKIWLTSVALDTFEIPRDCRDTIIQFAGIKQDFRLTQSISAVAPLVEALAQNGVSVNQLLSAGGSDSDSDSYFEPDWDYESDLNYDSDPW